LLRADNKIEFVKLGLGITNMVTGRYAVRSGRRIFDARWKESEFQQMRAAAQERPVALLRDRQRTLWTMNKRFYWEDEGLSEDDVKALIHQRERRSQQRLQSAHSLMRADEAGRPTRVPIPAELRRAVFERDSGRCVECGESFDIQYDHILPVSRGGATTLENLQLLCANCNRLKSDSI
jgi:5-methylcytosine-specific restriction endonuclease McrA